MLRDKAKRVIDAGVRTITVTVNAVDPQILAWICSHVTYDGKVHIGEDAARWLISAQIAGITRVVELGAVVKINTVLVPGINDHHIARVTRLAAKLGAATVNVIPLIPQHQLADHRAPNCHELQAAREEAEKYLPVFRHCKQCRADACGIPGSDNDFSLELYDQPVSFSHG